MMANRVQAITVDGIQHHHPPERSVAGAATQTLHRHIHSRRPANSAGLRYIAFNAADNRLSGT
ncbi:MAG: hypothetical protein AB1898_33275, partial [Acidobacteriota bacterium]